MLPHRDCTCDCTSMTSCFEKKKNRPLKLFVKSYSRIKPEIIHRCAVQRSSESSRIDEVSLQICRRTFERFYLRFWRTFFVHCVSGFVYILYNIWFLLCVLMCPKDLVRFIDTSSLFGKQPLHQKGLQQKSFFINSILG